MRSYDEVQRILEDIMDEFPEQLFNGLSGGVILSEQTKLHPKSQPYRPLFIMGEYHNDITGRYIVIYYGSFIKVYGWAGGSEFRARLRHTLAHELRHHLELLSGIHDLEDYDDQKLDMYNSGIDIAEFHEPPID